MKVPWQLADRAVLGLTVAAAILFSWPVLAPESAPPTDRGWMIYIGALIKATLLVTAAVFATCSMRGFERKIPVRRCWALLAGAFWSYAIGQFCLVYYQVIRKISTPFPSLADVFFVGAFVLLVCGLLAMIKTYLSSGFLEIRAAHIVVASAVGAAMAVAAGRVLLKPAAAGFESLSLAYLLGWFYPVSDIVLLVPAALLVGLTWQLRGGKVWFVWASLVLGLLCTTGGDVTFIFLEAGHRQLEPIVDWLYIASYAGFARASVTQYGLVVA